MNTQTGWIVSIDGTTEPRYGYSYIERPSRLAARLQLQLWGVSIIATLRRSSDLGDTTPRRVYSDIRRSREGKP